MTNQEFVAEHRGETVRLTPMSVGKWKKSFPESNPDKWLGVVLKRSIHPYITVLWRNGDGLGNYNTEDLEIVDGSQCDCGLHYHHACT